MLSAATAHQAHLWCVVLLERDDHPVMTHATLHAIFAAIGLEVGEMHSVLKRLCSHDSLNCVVTG
jgi:hypothetical protein